MVKIVQMMEDRAREREEERNQKLLDEKDRAGFFRASTASLTNGSV